MQPPGQASPSRRDPFPNDDASQSSPSQSAPISRESAIASEKLTPKEGEGVDKRLRRVRGQRRLTQEETKKYNVIRTVRINSDLHSLKEMEVQIKALKKEPEKNKAILSHLEEDKKNLITTIKESLFELLNEHLEVEKIIEDNPHILYEMFEGANHILESEEVQKIAQLIYNSCNPSVVSKLVNHFIKKNIESVSDPNTVLRETAGVLPRLVGIFQNELCKEAVGPDLDQSIKKHIVGKKLGKTESETGTKFKSIDEKHVMEHTHAIFEDLITNLQKHQLPSQLTSMYKTLYEGMTAKWQTKKDEAMRRVASLFFLQSVTPTLVIGSESNQMGKVHYETKDRANGILIGKAVTSVINNAPPDDPLMEDFRKSDFIKRSQPQVEKIALALLNIKK